MKNQDKINVDIQTGVLLTNQQGENLLDPKTPGSYNDNDIYVFTLNKDGTQTIIQKNLVRISNTVSYFLYINEFDLSRPDENGFGESTVYLHLNDQNTDTIKVEYQFKGATLSIIKLWYNSELKWKIGSPRLIKIVK